MATGDTLIGFLPKIGDGIAWVTEKITGGLANLFNVSITAFQSRLISLMVVAFAIYLVVSVITISKKLIKWGLVALFVLLCLSIIASIFA